MKLTNKLGLPEPLVEAIKNSGYNPGDSDITATGLLEPVRMHLLKEKYKDELTEDASDLIYSLQGQSIHTILERSAKALEQEGYIAERRFYFMCNGWKVGAQIDVFDKRRGVLQDYKVTSVYSVKDGIKEDYAKQLNIQAEAMRQNGFEVKQLQIVAILRDWSKGERDRDVKAMGDLASYPEYQVKILEVPLIPSKEVLEYVIERVNELRIGKESGVLPECSKEERWAKDNVWAMMKKGQKRATKLCSSEEQAKELLEVFGKEFSVEFREGISTRCENYCSVSKFCNQFLSMKEGVKK